MWSVWRISKSSPRKPDPDTEPTATGSTREVPPCTSLEACGRPSGGWRGHREARHRSAAWRPASDLRRADEERREGARATPRRDAAVARPDPHATTRHARRSGNKSQRRRACLTPRRLGPGKLSSCHRKAHCARRYPLVPMLGSRKVAVPGDPADIGEQDGALAADPDAAGGSEAAGEPPPRRRKNRFNVARILARFLELGPVALNRIHFSGRDCGPALSAAPAQARAKRGIAAGATSDLKRDASTATRFRASTIVGVHRLAAAIRLQYVDT